MADDDLDAPLGQNKRPHRKLMLPVRPAHLMVAPLVLSLGVFAGWATFANDPNGGEPVAVAALDLPASSEAEAAPAAAPAAPAAPGQPMAPRRYDGGGADGTQRTVTIIDGSTGKRQEVVLSGNGERRIAVPPAGPNSSLPAAPAAAASAGAPPVGGVLPPSMGGDPRLLERSRHGDIPRIAPDGARASDVYATLAKPVSGKPDAPRIAIIVGGLGVGAAVTDDAIAKLPDPVTLAFLPYAKDVAQKVMRARGHEILLQVPMEPFDYPDNDPGPQTLLTSLDTGQNIDRLQWLMSRFQGYVGLANYMGARFSASEAAMGAVLGEAGKRGLIYVDDGSASRSLAGQLAGATNLPFVKADVQIDSVPTSTDVDRALSRLEAVARQRGSAVGWAHALPLSIERIARWAKAAESRGIQVVPITVLAANKSKST